MRVLMLSKALVVGQYQSKLAELAKHPDFELFAALPPFWRDEHGIMRLEHVPARGYELIVTPMAFNGSFHLHYYPQLPRLLQQIQPHIVHIDEEPYNYATYHAMRAAHKVGASTLFFTWQNIFRKYPPPFSIFESYAYDHSLYAIAGNQAAADILRAKHFSAPIGIIPQFGVDPTEFAPTPPSGQISDGIFCIGFAGGRLVEEKGVQVLLNTVARLSGNWQLHILGDGPYKSRLQSLARSLKIEERITWEPRRASNAMPAFYNAMDVIVLPSLTRKKWKEQFGRVLIEAMACEVPVIASDSGEIPNVISDAGIIFPEGKPEALRTHLDALMHDEARCVELGKRGRARVLAKFTQAYVAEETYSVYGQIMEMRRVGVQSEIKNKS